MGQCRIPPPTPREIAVLAKLAAPAPRTIAYCRVSTEMQAEEGQSLEVQRRQLEGWAQMRGSMITDVVVEPGVSGGTRSHSARRAASYGLPYAKGTCWWPPSSTACSAAPSIA